MGFFKYINFPVFIISLVIGMYAVYITLPDSRKIYVFPTPENIDLLQYRDKTNTCFSLSQKEFDIMRGLATINSLRRDLDFLFVITSLNLSSNLLLFLRISCNKSG